MCILKKKIIEAYYNPTIGMNSISKALAEELCPNESLIPSHKLLRTPSGVTIESYGVIRSIPLRIRGSKYHLDFHIYDILDTTLLIGVPLGTLFQEQSKQSLLNLNLGNSTINVSLAHSHNAIIESKLEQDLVEEVLMASLEDLAQPIFDDEHFIKEEEELVEPVELDPFEVPSQPSIELKPLPLGLKYVFLNNNQETPIIITDNLSHKETCRLVIVLERHRSAIGYSLHDLIGISPVLCTHRLSMDPDISQTREPRQRLNNAT
jgi:hypothetical protein